MAQDVDEYVASCFRCQFAKAATHGTAQRGELTPTLAPHVHHTWYADLKGPLPHGTGYILVVVEALTRFVKLRYLPDATARQVCEELEEAIISFGTRPVVLRTDGGPPFDSDEYRAFCEREGITPVLGAPHHSQGQGLVETRLRGIAGAIMATLGHKAPRTWFEGPLLGRLEGVINATFVQPLGGSPYWAMHGREPRTRASAAVDWTSQTFGEQVMGVEGATLNDLNEVLAAHHAAIDAVQGRVSLASSLAQALTKRSWDAARRRGATRVGDWVLVHVAAPNRLLPHFTGPYRVVSVTPDGNFVRARHFLSRAPEGTGDGPFHVSRLLDFDMSRATNVELADFQLDAGSEIVDAVSDHRVLGDGTTEFLIHWLGNPVPSWCASQGLRKVLKVIVYCATRGLPAPGTEPRGSAAPAGPARWPLVRVAGG